jgi:hypothetical protein
MVGMGEGQEKGESAGLYNNNKVLGVVVVSSEPWASGERAWLFTSKTGPQRLHGAGQSLRHPGIVLAVRSAKGHAFPSFPSRPSRPSRRTPAAREPNRHGGGCGVRLSVTVPRAPMAVSITAWAF